MQSLFISQVRILDDFESERLILSSNLKKNKNNVFDFTGHGSQIADRDNEEEDGFDETLIPGDYVDAGPIIDDEIYSMFVTKVSAGVHVVAMIDCCHSGTALDLPYVCNVGDGEIHRDEGFKMPIVDKVKKEKKKKKKESTKKEPTKKKGTKKKKKASKE